MRPAARSINASGTKDAAPVALAVRSRGNTRALRLGAHWRSTRRCRRTQDNWPLPSQTQQTGVKVVTEEQSPPAGTRTYTWDFRTEGSARMRMPGVLTAWWMNGNAGRTPAWWCVPDEPRPRNWVLKWSAMIKRYAPLARRSHDELVLPGTDGNPVSAEIPIQ